MLWSICKEIILWIVVICGCLGGGLLLISGLMYIGMDVEIRFCVELLYGVVYGTGMAILVVERYG